MHKKPKTFTRSKTGTQNIRLVAAIAAVLWSCVIALTLSVGMMAVGLIRLF